jgi:hypothetical protein
MGIPIYSIMEFPLLYSSTLYNGRRGSAILELNTTTGHLRILREKEEAENIVGLPFSSTHSVTLEVYLYRFPDSTGLLGNSNCLYS